ncbi:hypothetical protein AB0I69_42775 [Streptomyces sp. NPDC050508]|uniref:hypothetical protein n=1 Tax=Streptomyces sp. NPDC050508 TaxID=3155405 RepID=UPI00342FE34E
MSVATLSAPPARSALFPPPAVPLHFADGDHYEWPATGDVWVRTAGEWRPKPNDGSGYLTDEEVRGLLHAAVTRWDVGQRFVPAVPGDILPGWRILALPPVCDVAQYVLDHQGAGLVPLRELVARHDEDGAYDVPGVISGSAMTDVLTMIVAEHSRTQVSYDKAAGRVYVRYQRPSDFGPWQEALPSFVTCLHVFVFAASPAEA